MDRLDELIKRANEERHMPIDKFIEKENLSKYELGYEDILYADDLNNAIIPCYDYMILARERLDENYNTVAEYAIYSQHDKDGKNIMNSLNMNATYELEYAGDQLFDNMAAAIAYAFNLIHQLHQNELNNEKENDHE